MIVQRGATRNLGIDAAGPVICDGKCRTDVLAGRADKALRDAIGRIVAKPAAKLL